MRKTFVYLLILGLTYFISCDRPNHHPSIFQKVERLMPQHPDSALAQKQWEQAALLSKRYELSHDSIEKARLEQELETEKNKCITLSKRKDVLTYVIIRICNRLLLNILQVISQKYGLNL